MTAGAKLAASGYDAADPNFAGRRVGKKFDLLDALPELIECGEPVLENRATIERGLDTLPAALEQTHAERVLEIGNRL